MVYIQKSNPFKQKSKYPYGWTEQEYNRAKQETIKNFDSIKKLNPKDSTLEWQEFGKDQERYFTNQEKLNDLKNYAKETFNIDLK